jgi:hypothetical protein
MDLLPEAGAELKRLIDYAEIFGKTAPSQAMVTQTLDSAYRWTSLRVALGAWIKYAKAQEVAGWGSARALFDRLQPAFGLAVRTDAAIGEQNPSLAGLLQVRGTIAKRGAATRQANKKKEANGEKPYAGLVGQRRKRKDEKAALTAQSAVVVPAGGAPSAHPTGSSAATAAPGVTGAPPAPTPMAPQPTATAQHD